MSQAADFATAAPHLAHDRPPLARRIVRYGAVSALSLVVNVGGAWSLYTLAGLAEELAYAISLTAVFLMNFLLMRGWVFNARAGRARRQLAGYTATAAGFRFCEWLTFLGLHTAMGLDPTLSILAISCVATGLKFLVHNRAVFRHPAASAAVAADLPLETWPGTAPGNALSPTPAALLRRHAPAITALLLSIGVCGAVLGPRIIHPNLYEDDAAQHVFWAQQAWNSNLPAVDPVARFFASDAASPPAWRALLAGLSSLGDVQVVTEIANLLLVLLTAAFMYVLGRRVAGGDGWGGVTAVALFLLLQPLTEWYLFGLLQRSFALPVALMMVWGLMTRRLWVAGLSLLLAALIYPVSLVILGSLALVHEAYLLLWKLSESQPLGSGLLPRGWWVATILGIAAVGVVALRNVPAEYGQLVEWSQTRALPEFMDGGRAAYWLEDPVAFYLNHHRTGLGYTPMALALATAVLLALGSLTGRRAIRSVPLVVWLLIPLSLGLWTLAHVVAPRLYLPNRHAVTTLPLAFLLLCAALGPPAWRRLEAMLSASMDSPQDQGRAERALRSPRRSVLACAAFLLVAVALTAGPFRAELNAWERQAFTQSIAYLHQTPPDTLIAAHPVEADPLSLRTGRPVLISVETALPYYRGYYEDLALPRIEAALAAYYATDWETVDRLYEQYGVRIYFYRAHHLQRLPPVEPFRSIARRHFQEAGGRPPVMYNPPPERILMWWGDVALIRVGPDDGTLPRLGGPGPWPDLPPPPAYGPDAEILPDRRTHPLALRPVR